MASKYYTIEECLNVIDEPNKTISLKILKDNIDLFSKVPGSTNNHQAWEGGYLDHITEVMNIACLLYHSLNNARKLPFSLSDSLFILYLHDIEKPWRFESSGDGSWKNKDSLETKEQKQDFRERKLREYGIILTEEQENALKYVEGEHKNYSDKKRVMGPLAAFCHLCDTWSARGWFDYPLKSEDPWKHS